MKNYRYMGYDFRATSNTHANTGRPLYEVDGMKPAGMRPFLTTISETREFIRNAVEMGYWLDGNAGTHYVKNR